MLYLASYMMKYHMLWKAINYARLPKLCTIGDSQLGVMRNGFCGALLMCKFGKALNLKSLLFPQGYCSYSTS